MKRTLVLTLVPFTAFAQPRQGYEGLINAEHNFAAYSVAHGMRGAFLKYLDSRSIVFDMEKPLNGPAFWETKEEQQGVLDWNPRFAEISASEDFGYTTGPWTYRSKKKEDSITSGGQYVTIWHFDQGRWSVLLDMGIENTPAESTGEVQSLITQTYPRGPSSESALLEVERSFIRAYGNDPLAAYRDNLSVVSILLQDGRSPAYTSNDRQQVIKNAPAAISFAIGGCGIAPGSEIGYVYGSATIHGKTDSYLHIWRREIDGWKIAVEVLHP